MTDDIRNEIRVDVAEAERQRAAWERDAALDIAANEAANRDLAEANAVDARIAARQAGSAARELATERNMLRSQIAAERTAASNNAFGFYLVLGLVLAVLIVAGFYWLYWKPNNPESVNVFASSPAPSPPSVVTTPPPASTSTPSPVVVTPPPHVTVNPPAVHNNIVVPPSAPSQGSTPPNADTQNGATNSGSNTTGSDNTAPSAP